MNAVRNKWHPVFRKYLALWHSYPKIYQNICDCKHETSLRICVDYNSVLLRPPTVILLLKQFIASFLSHSGKYNNADYLWIMYNMLFGAEQCIFSSIIPSDITYLSIISHFCVVVFYERFAACRLCVFFFLVNNRVVNTIQNTIWLIK